jgi:hypothetical protein
VKLKTTYYLSGPMTGYYRYNYAAFESASRMMRIAGMDVLSPHEIDHGEAEPGQSGKRWDEYMRPALGLLLQADVIVLLAGWSQSRGAVKELDTALSLGMSVYLYTGKTPWPITNIG